MKNIFSRLKSMPKRISAIAIIAAAVIIPAAAMAWGPSRPTYTIQNPAPHVTFNSITNNPVHGDERNFVLIKEKGAADSTYNDDQSLTPGKDYTVYVYYHNNAASNLNASGKGIAKDVVMRTEIPALVKAKTNDTKAVGYINSSNAQPKSVWDHVNLDNTTTGDIALRIVPSTAKIHSFGAVNGKTLSDNIVTTGVKLGFNELDGTLPGCNEYAGYVTFDLRAVQANFTVEKQVRMNGDKPWVESVNAQAGDTVDYLISYKNTGNVIQNDVTIKDELPKGMTYVNGSTKVANASNPSGVTVSDNVTTTGINIGNYKPGANAYIMFSAKVDSDGDDLVCGPNTLRNVATVETDNGYKNDTADVKVNKACEPEQISVCELSTKNIITIDEADFDSKKHSKNLSDCDEKTTKINVCELSTKKIVTIDQADFDSKKYSKDLSLCDTPSELPQTGVGENIVALVGLGSLIASIGYYIASRRATANL